MKKFSSNFTSFCRGQKGDVYTKNCIRKRKYYKQKVILRLKKCPIGRKITDSVGVSATIIFCLIRVAFTFSLQQKKEVSKLLTKSKYFSDLLNTTINVLRTAVHDVLLSDRIGVQFSACFP